MPVKSYAVSNFISVILLTFYPYSIVHDDIWSCYPVRAIIFFYLQLITVVCPPVAIKVNYWISLSECCVFIVTRLFLSENREESNAAYTWKIKCKLFFWYWVNIKVWSSFFLSLGCVPSCNSLNLDGFTFSVSYILLLSYVFQHCRGILKFMKTSSVPHPKCL